MGRRVLLRGGFVLSMDDRLGELPTGDVLIEDEVIVAVETSIAVEDADVVDAAGCVVMPGFVDTHRHTWQTPFRGVCADWTLEDYFRGIRMSISPNCSAEDVYAGNYVGALEALDPGVTTILDFSHCNNTPEHADAAVKGLRDAGIRAVFAYGYYPAPAAEPIFTTHKQRLADARRIREQLSSDDGLITMGVALTEVGLLPFEQTIAEVRSAHELGVPACFTPAVTGGRPSPRAYRSSTTTVCSRTTRCTYIATPLTSVTSAGWRRTSARSPPVPRPRSRWAWDTRSSVAPSSAVCARACPAM